MIEYFNNPKIISRYLQIFYEHSRNRTYKFVLKKVFRITIYSLYALFTVEELMELFNNFSIKKSNIYINKIINDRDQLPEIIEEQIYY